MRNLVKYALLIMLAAGISSCEKIRSIFDVEIDTTLSGELDIDIQDQALKSVLDYAFKSQEDIDPLDDDDIAEYEENIKDMDVKGILATVVYVSKENVEFKAGTAFSISDQMSNVVWTLDDDWPIAEGTTITLGDLGDVYKAVAEILNRKKPFTIGAEGTCTQTDVYITIRMDIDTKVTANPL